MSSPDVERRLRQQGADVDALYEISSRIEGKVDALDSRVSSLGDRVSSLDAKLEQLAESTSVQFEAQSARFDTLEQRTSARFDALERSNEQTQTLLTQILERLNRA
ncbi:hypothetical protein FVA95_28720 [Pseudonocardia sp. EV170527-09]|uniref:hypothetical protein n=1 Tax=Pseudonocardia sp. EV170527-09 TaxID=2603411 RepID=UPI0011F16DFF|nr:hypothetical protein [Pseudonocardia sp. EV170527-09]KAA1006836.1 hypothetical protein FVA95_28720 [Pseudonocardia sp. EV170527-09]